MTGSFAADDVFMTSTEPVVDPNAKDLAKIHRNNEIEIAKKNPRRHKLVEAAKNFFRFDGPKPTRYPEEFLNLIDETLQAEAAELRRELQLGKPKPPKVLAFLDHYNTMAATSSDSKQYHLEIAPLMMIQRGDSPRTVYQSLFGKVVSLLEDHPELEPLIFLREAMVLHQTLAYHPKSTIAEGEDSLTGRARSLKHKLTIRDMRMKKDDLRTRTLERAFIDASARLVDSKTIAELEPGQKHIPTVYDSEPNDLTELRTSPSTRAYARSLKQAFTNDDSDILNSFSREFRTILTASQISLQDIQAAQEDNQALYILLSRIVKTALTRNQVRSLEVAKLMFLLRGALVDTGKVILGSEAALSTTAHLPVKLTNRLVSHIGRIQADILEENISDLKLAAKQIQKQDPDFTSVVFTENGDFNGQIKNHFQTITQATTDPSLPIKQLYDEQALHPLIRFLEANEELMRKLQLDYFDSSNQSISKYIYQLGIGLYRRSQSRDDMTRAELMQLSELTTVLACLAKYWDRTNLKQVTKSEDDTR